MKTDIEYLARIPDLTSNEFDLFQESLRILLSKTFIIRGKGEEALYDFAIRNLAIYEAWFECMGASVIKDESLGVIAFRGWHGTKLSLNKEETCALLVLRLLYEDKRAEPRLTEFPTVTVFDFVQKYNAMTNSQLGKTKLADIQKRLKSFKLIGTTSDELADMESAIILYPSIAIAVDRDGVDNLIENLAGESENVIAGEIETETVPED
jgi:hypothetical protein